MPVSIIEHALELARSGEARNETELIGILKSEGFAPSAKLLSGTAMKKLLNARFKEASRAVEAKL